MENRIRRSRDRRTVAAVSDSTPPLPAVISLRDAAAYIGIREATLRDWRVDRKGPPAVKYGRLVRYRPIDLDQWIADQVEQ